MSRVHPRRPSAGAAGWRLRRLTAMSPSELAARAARAARHSLDDLSYRAARPFWRRAWQPSGGAIVVAARPAAPVGPLTQARADGLAERDPAAAAAIVALAERVLAGRYHYFGYPEVELAPPLDFARDPYTGSRWPDRHGKRLDYRHDAPGDPKWAWELNRLQELPPLVEAWLLTGDERFARHALGLAGRWLQTNEPGRGVPWSNGYEAALRAISLALTLDALRGSSLLPRETEDALARALWQHGRWIVRDPSTHSSANNHLLGELAGLVTIGLLAPELAPGERWLEHGLLGLGAEAGRQIAPDGTSVEQSFRYHLHVVDLLLLVVALLDARSRPVPPPLTDALSRSAAALAAQLGDGEPEPAYGDADDAWVVRLDGLERREARGVASALAARLGHEGARRVASSLDAAAWWLFGAEGAQRFASTPVAAAPASVVLPDAGLVHLRAGESRVTLDAGPLGYLSIAAHGHADALQLTLAHRGAELVVDPGVGSYFARPELRSAFRGTSFHATLSVDGEDQSVSGGPFLWRRHASARLLHVDLAAGVCLAEHDGYLRLADPVLHRRLVVAQPDGAIVVHDRLAAKDAHRLVQTWPLHPSLTAKATGAGEVRACCGDAPRLQLLLAASSPGRIVLARGQDDPPRGWFSAGLERVEPATLVTYEVEGVGQTDLVAVLRPLDGGPWPQAGLSLEPAAEGLRVVYTGPGGPVALLLDPERVEQPARRLDGGAE